MKASPSPKTVSRGEVIHLKPGAISAIVMSTAGAKPRPWLVVSRTVFEGRIVVAVMTTYKGYEARRRHVRLYSEESKSKDDGLIKCDEIYTVNADDVLLLNPRKRISPKKMQEVSEALRYTLDLNYDNPPL
jgi:mRNA-degrading endonuclease toxin of MazEF toxin-antitoxin module